MAASNLSARRVAANAMAGLAILALCSCSRDSAAVDLTGGPTTNTEQTIAPTTRAVAEKPFEVRTAKEGDWAVYTDGYVFSETPQGVGEQFILDTYPDLWAQGVRVLSNKMVPGHNFADPATPGAVVQYINGERYEGTISTPLGFRGQTASPEALPSDAVANNIAAINGDGAWPAGNTGQGGYTLTINEKDRSGKGTALEVYQFIDNDQTKKLGSTMYFSGWEEAWAYAQANGFSVPGMERALYPGEVATVEVLRAKGATGMSLWVFDSSINDWALAVNYDK